jgi:predicted transcriptional regulator
MTTIATATLAVTLPADTKKRLDRLAAAASASPSELAAEAIRSYLEVQEWQVEEIRAGVREADASDFASSEEVQAVFDKWTREG